MSTLIRRAMNRCSPRLIRSIVACTIAVTGCAEISSVQQVGQGPSKYDRSIFSGQTLKLGDAAPSADDFRVFHQGATWLVPMETVRDEAEASAMQVCERRRQVVKPLRETTSKPPHLLGNYPRIELVFSCVNPPAIDLAAGQPAMAPAQNR